jgi:hypothetical protein
MPTYCFLDVAATLTGPGGTISLGSGAGDAEEGISVEFLEDKARLVTGADGTPMISMNPSKAGRILVRLLKTSPVNALLNQMYNLQIASSLVFGQNVLVVTNLITGDDYTCTSVAFEKHPRNDYGKEAGMLEWNFLAGVIDPVLGSGILANAV